MKIKNFDPLDLLFLLVISILILRFYGKRMDTKAKTLACFEKSSSTAGGKFSKYQYEWVSYHMIPSRISTFHDNIIVEKSRIVKVTLPNITKARSFSLEPTLLECNLTMN